MTVLIYIRDEVFYTIYTSCSDDTIYTLFTASLYCYSIRETGSQKARTTYRGTTFIFQKIMKKFKHKVTWRETVWTTEKDKIWCFIVWEEGTSCWFLPEKLVECDPNREEVVEKDWISKCVDEIFEYQRWRPWDEPDYVSVWKIIEKHAPKEKKFTVREIDKYGNKNWKSGFEISNVVSFLQDHNLLSDTD